MKSYSFQNKGEPWLQPNLPSQSRPLNIHLTPIICIKEKENPYTPIHSLPTRMEWSPDLNRQTACNLVAVDAGIWCNSGRRSFRYGLNLTRSNEDEFESLNFPIKPSKTPKWLVLWRRLKKGKRRIFASTSSFQIPYDPYTYSQNFDHGSASLDPENVSRSFSARYADPSSIFQRVGWCNKM